jgi:integrase
MRARNYSLRSTLHAGASDSGCGVARHPPGTAPSSGLGTHSFRHTYRSWLDQVGTQLAVQQKAMRHTDIRTTMIYGDVVDGRIGQALWKLLPLWASRSVAVVLNITRQEPIEAPEPWPCVVSG